jgi:hypothetical protein
MGETGPILVPAAQSARLPVAPPRRQSSRRRRTPAGLMPVAAVLAVLPFALTARAQDTVALEVGTVLANNASTQIDAELASIRGQLERLFQYSSYRLMKQEQSDVSCGKPASFEIPGGRHLQVMAKDARGGRVSLNVALVKDRHVLMRTDLTLGKRGMIMVGGPRYENGVLIIWIGARRSNAPGVAP